MSNQPFDYAKHVADELRRMLDRQKELPVESMEYNQLMTNMEILAQTADMYSDIADFFAMVDSGIRKIEIIPGGKVEDDTPGCVDEPYVEEPKQFESVPAQVSSEDVKPSADEQEEPAKVYDPADVRAALVAARRAGTNVTELLKEFGVDNFGAFPAGKYGELMKRLGAE